MNKIINPLGYYPDPTKFGTLDSGVLYIGDPDVGALNVVANQKQVSDLQENNTLINIAQPISLSPGGIPLSADGLRYPSLFVDGDYSMLVLDALGGSQIYYIPSAKVIVYTDSATTNSLTNDAFDVSGVGTLYCNTTSNNVTIGGFINGEDGQTIRIIKYVTANDMIIENDEGVVDSQDIFLDKGADKTFSTLGGITVTYKDGVGWFESTAIAAGAVDTVDIADDAITIAKMSDNSVDSAEIVAGAVDTAELAAGAVTTVKIEDEAVTYAKLSDSTDGLVNTQNKVAAAVAVFGWSGAAIVKKYYENVEKVERLTTEGRYTITLENPMASGSYGVLVSSSQNETGIGAPLHYVNVFNELVGSFEVQVWNSTVVTDSGNVTCVVYGNLDLT